MSSMSTPPSSSGDAEPGRVPDVLVVVRVDATERWPHPPRAPLAHHRPARARGDPIPQRVGRLHHSRRAIPTRDRADRDNGPRSRRHRSARRTHIPLMPRRHLILLGSLVVAALVAVATASAGLPPPDTTIDSGPSGVTNSTSASFAFSSPEDPLRVTYECALDGAGFSPCTSPPQTQTYTGLTDGSHTFTGCVRSCSGCCRIRIRHPGAGQLTPCRPRSRSRSRATRSPTCPAVPTSHTASPQPTTPTPIRLSTAAHHLHPAPLSPSVKRSPSPAKPRTTLATPTATQRHSPPRRLQTPPPWSPRPRAERSRRTGLAGPSSTMKAQRRSTTSTGRCRRTSSPARSRLARYSRSARPW